MRLAMLLLVLLIALPLLAQSGETAGFAVSPTPEAPEVTSTLSPEVSEIILPTATPLPTDEAAPVTGITPFPTENVPVSLPPPAATPAGAQPVDLTVEVTAQLEPTGASTDSVETLPPGVIGSIPPTAVHLPTETALLNDGASPLPTAVMFPTVDLSTAVAPALIPNAVPLTLPALATLDDGAGDWLGSPDWSLQPHESGLAWVMTGTGSQQLRWQTPIDLRTVSPGVVLSFQSRFVGDGLAVVQVSSDGLNWQPVSGVSASDSWTTVRLHLDGYIGSVIWIGFVWQDTYVETQDQWAVDTVLVSVVTPSTLGPPALTMPPVATVLSPTEVETVATTAPTEENTETVVEPSPTSTLVPTETEGSATQEQSGSTPTATVSPESIACDLDVDADGTVTDRDLSQIGRQSLNTNVDATTTIYDLNRNYQIDIGDLQLMAGYLFRTCSD